MINSRFCYVNKKKVHYLTAGKGAPLVLLHPSPFSSEILVPFIKLLAPYYSVIALDTPGYGKSDSLDQKPENLSEYCDYLKPFFEKMGLRKFAIYGTATGAQLGIRYALTFPKQVQHLYLDNAAHFKEEQRNAILKSYFPDIRPKYDGSHLMTVWTMVHDLFLFFPWCFSESKYRLKTPFPPAKVLHQFALSYFKAGDKYDWAYRAAFDHEKAENVQLLKVPTSLFHWKASILKPYIEQLVAFDLPSNLTEVKIPVTPAERFEAMKNNIIHTYQNEEYDNYHFSDFGEPEQVEAKKEQSAISGLPKLIPDENGLYLIKAWHTLRNLQLYKTSANRSVENIRETSPNLDPFFLQAQLIEWMGKKD